MVMNVRDAPHSSGLHGQQPKRASAMIYEHAILTIHPGQCAQFEQAFVHARQVIGRAVGCDAVVLRRSIEAPARYTLIVEWLSVEHHMEGFRNSALFTEWRALLGPFFANQPQVEHCTTVE